MDECNRSTLNGFCERGNQKLSTRLTGCFKNQKFFKMCAIQTNNPLDQWAIILKHGKAI